MSFGTSSCTNASGPICYNTAISGENLLTGWVAGACTAAVAVASLSMVALAWRAGGSSARRHGRLPVFTNQPACAPSYPLLPLPPAFRAFLPRSMWVNLILGLICYLGFILFRGMKGFEFYHARLVSTAGAAHACEAQCSAANARSIEAAAGCSVAAGKGAAPAAVGARSVSRLAVCSLPTAPRPPHHRTPPASRLQLLPAVSRKPPQLSLHGHQRLWGWLLPVFKVSDEELVRSAGLDALIAV